MVVVMAVVAATVGEKWFPPAVWLFLHLQDQKTSHSGASGAFQPEQRGHVVKVLGQHSLKGLPFAEVEEAWVWIC